MASYEELKRLIRRLHSEAGDVQPLHWRPAADVYRTAEGWLVKVELAGVPSEAVEVRTRGRTLVIRGRRCDSELVEGRQHYALEIAYSQFERCLELPVDLDQARLETECREGMLLVRIITCPGEEGA